MDEKRNDSNQTKPTLGRAALAAKPARGDQAAGASASRDAPPMAASALEGKPAPPFRLMADDGREVRLEDFAGKRLVLYFYPKDDTPGCTREACGFQESLAAVHGRGAEVVGVSRDLPDKHVAFKKKYGLAFPLLSDPQAAVHRAYGAWGTKTSYGKETEGVLRTTFVIDERGRVTKVFSNVKVDGHAEEVLEAVGR